MGGRNEQDLFQNKCNYVYILAAAASAKGRNIEVRIDTYTKREGNMKENNNPTNQKSAKLLFTYFVY